MKTPREILLERHQNALPKLEAMREEILKAGGQSSQLENESVQPRFHFLMLPMKLWQELFAPYRRMWQGVAAVWVVIAAVNLIGESNAAETPLAKSNVAPTPEVMAALREQRLLLAQLLESTSTSAPADRPKNSPPRSELETTSAIV